MPRPVGGRPIYGYATPAVGARHASPCWWSPNLRVRYPDQGEACLAPTTRHFLITRLIFIIRRAGSPRMRVITEIPGSTLPKPDNSRQFPTFFAKWVPPTLTWVLNFEPK